MFMKSVIGLASPGGRNGRLSILIFHRVLDAPDPLAPSEPDIARFHELMRWIADWYNVLPFDEAVARLRSGSLPPRAAAITFDDGHVDGYTHALPVLQHYGLSAIFFVPGGFIDGGWMWDDSLVEAVRNAQGDWLETGIASIPAAPVRTTAEKLALLTRLVTTVKYLPPSARRDIVARIVESSGVTLAGSIMLNAAQIRALRDAGMQIGSHTLTHPLLAICTEAEAEAEIAADRERLAAVLGEPVRFFAYPNGKPYADYSRRHVEMVRRLGFEAAVTTCWGVNTRKTDPYQLLRFTPWDRNRLRFGMHMFSSFFYPANKTLPVPLDGGYPVERELS
jgi:peptidoglycan/xylan/chitin deacetylase (PgdA/CDA1 family)